MAVLAVGLTILVFLALLHLLILNKFHRATIAEEVIGQDIYKLAQKNEKVFNYVQEAINEFYPSNINDYLVSKYKLLKKVKMGSAQAQERLRNEDVYKLRSYIEKAMNLVKKKKLNQMELNGQLALYRQETPNDQMVKEVIERQESLQPKLEKTEEETNPREIENGGTSSENSKKTNSPPVNDELSNESEGVIVTESSMGNDEKLIPEGASKFNNNFKNGSSNY